MTYSPKEAEKEMEKAIFISADCWLFVFDLLPRSQLGFGIAMISRRFDYFTEEHFKTRKWTFGKLKIRSKIGEDGAKEIEIVNSDGKALPIPQNPLPNKFIGFKSISIDFIDQNVLTFLRRFHRLFPVCTTLLFIRTENVRISKFAVLNILPMLKDTIRLIDLTTVTFRQMRQFVPSMLNDCPLLHRVCFYDGILPEFPADDSANATDSQAMAKWLFSPRADNLPNLLFVKIGDSAMDQWTATLEQIKAAFSSASAPLNFGIHFLFRLSAPFHSILPFKMTNELTGEQLTLSKLTREHPTPSHQYASAFKLIRSPIGIDERK